jgi:hypothetical protein
MAAETPSVGDDALLERRRMGNHNVDATTFCAVQSGACSERFVFNGNCRATCVGAFECWQETSLNGPDGAGNSQRSPVMHGRTKR